MDEKPADTRDDTMRAEEEKQEFAKKAGRELADHLLTLVQFRKENRNAPLSIALGAFHRKVQEMTSDDRRYIVAFPLADLKKILTAADPEYF